MRAPLAAAAAVVLLVPFRGASAAASCSPPVSGGTAAEQAAAQRVLCNMRGTPIASVQILGQAPDAPSDALWLAIAVPSPTRARSSLLTYYRAKWEANIVAGAIRDAFVRLGFPDVIGYQELSDVDQPDARRIVGVALREWHLPRWGNGGRPHPRGGRMDPWSRLQSKLDLLSRRFRAHTRLDRYEPFGRAPLVTVSTGSPSDFIAAGGFAAYEEALHYRSPHFDGVLLRVISPVFAGVQVDLVNRGRPTAGCAVLGHVRYSSRICPAD